LPESFLELSFLEGASILRVKLAEVFLEVCALVCDGVCNPSQDAIALRLAGQLVDVVNEFTGSNIALLSFILGLEKVIQLFRCQIWDLAVQKSLIELRLVDDSFLKMVQLADDLNKIAVELGEYLSARDLTLCLLLGRETTGS